ncbi:MAG TPA: hypothetical protein VEB19_05600 [Gemmatimonadaceae bacterium]|nr:hypothetical protein [Gemmatimonadaceae bacterium]
MRRDVFIEPCPELVIVDEPHPVEDASRRLALLWQPPLWGRRDARENKLSDRRVTELVWMHAIERLGSAVEPRFSRHLADITQQVDQLDVGVAGRDSGKLLVNVIVMVRLRRPVQSGNHEDDDPQPPLLLLDPI